MLAKWFLLLWQTTAKLKGDQLLHRIPVIGPGWVDIFNRVAKRNIWMYYSIQVQTEYHLLTCKKLVMADVRLLFGADIYVGKRQLRMDNRL